MFLMSGPGGGSVDVLELMRKNADRRRRRKRLLLTMV